MYRVSLISLVLLCFQLSACASIPDPEDIPNVDAYDIITRLRCEVREALDEDYYKGHWINKHYIGYGLQLVTIENRAKTGQLIGTWPINLGSFSLQADVGATRKNTGDSKIDYSEVISAPSKQDCDTADDPRTAALYPVTGKVGMRKVIERYVRIKNLGGNFKATTGFVDTKIFKLTFNGGIKPSFSIVNPVSGRSASGNINLTADRSDEHTLIIVIAPPPPEKNDPTLNVKITNWPKIIGGDNKEFGTLNSSDINIDNTKSRSSREGAESVLRKLQQERDDRNRREIKDLLRDN